MRLRRLSVRDFGCVGSAEVRFGAGLNVLYGPNDLGKSTLAAAIRAALLLQPGSSGARPFIPWGSARTPEVDLEFDIDERVWKVEKRFAEGGGGLARLSWSNDGNAFTAAHEGRAVDGELRKLLQWGIAQPGGKGGKHGLPRSFLASVLLGEQAVPYRLFESSLAEDADDGGKTRLTEALAALATDPLYQDVLAAAQGRVDEAFTATGRKRQTKTSPFTRVAAEINARREATEELERKVAESDAVGSRLAELDAQRDRRMAELAVATEAWERAQEAFAKVSARSALGDQLAKVRSELEDIERNKAEIQRLEAETSALLAAEPAAALALEAASLRRTQTDLALAKLGDQLVQQDAGGDPQGQLERERLTVAIAEAEAASGRAQQRLEGLAQWRTTVEAVAASELAAEAAAAKLANLDSVAARLEHTRAELEAFVGWAQIHRAEERVAQTRALARASSELKAQAAVLTASAATELRNIAELGLPEETEYEAWRETHEAMALAKARTAGGIRIRTELHAAGDVQIAMDDGPAVPAVPAATLHAIARATLEVAGVGRFELASGSAKALEAYEAAQRQWETSVAPRLAALGLRSLEDLAPLLADSAERRARATAMSEEARTLERMTTDHDAKLAAVETAERDLAGLRARSDVGDEAPAGAASRTVEELEQSLRAAQTELAAATRSQGEAAAVAAATRAALELSLERSRSAAAALGIDADGGDDGDPRNPEAIERSVASEYAATIAALTQLQQHHREHVASANERRQVLAAQHEAAKEALVAATAEVATLEAELRSLRDRLAAGNAALKVRHEQAQHRDAFAVAEAFARLSDELAAADVPTEEIDEEELDRRAAAVKSAELEVEDASTQVRQQEGALGHVGGQVVREKAESAREALEAAQRREAEVELDYEGWRLLLDTLRAAENEEGSHLGRALAGEVADRFAELTKGRYGGLDLGPELQARGLATATGTQPLERFSEGIKEQLATILRVSVAEHLDGALLLDDHLAQTDPARAGWFRELLVTAAGRIQVIVLTCRPADYLADGQDDVHALDLNDRIVRS